jgi:chemotaxis protein MotB
MQSGEPERCGALVQRDRTSPTREGLRIDMVDEADFTMFVSGTDLLTPDAAQLLQHVAGAMRDVPNGIIIRGHTDAIPYSRGKLMNNWQLSAYRAEATRVFLTRQSIDPRRFYRIEGVADREPYIPGDILDPRNRRMSITLGWRELG